MKKRVLILHTGGTLGMVGGHPGPLTPPSNLADAAARIVAGRAASKPSPLTALLERVPELADIAELRMEILAQQDSCDVTADQWIAWADRIRSERDADGVVLIHGTDTMAYTASALSFLLEDRPLPIILTGSQRPLSAVRNDARQNLVDAVILACGPLREVLVCFDSLGLRGNRTMKRSSALMGAFESPNCPPLVNLGVDIRWNDHGLSSTGVARRLELGDRVRLSWVMPDLAAPPAWTPDAPAVHVLACLGSGNIPLHVGWQALVRQEAAAGVTHLMVSQCPHGGVRAGLYESSRELIDAGVLSGGDLTYIAAVVKARVGLGQGFRGDDLARYLTRPVAGELTLDVAPEEEPAG